ncbi:MAG TPA: HDOD domain-containing protein [Kineosporiaceae bacterium]|jgi:EAL and modified HD-GYP domain-containing signal transduction protein|nr:HDOD domain-containing protein [Kineosporiaceae bacterium]
MPAQPPVSVSVPSATSDQGAASAGTGGRTVAHGGLIRDVRVARQAVYDAARRLVSYELQFRLPDSDSHAARDGGDGVGAGAIDDAGHDAPEGAGPASEVSGEQATSQVISTTFGTFGLDTVSGGKPVFVTFTRPFLTGVLPLPVEPAGVIVEVPDHVGVDHELLLGLAELKQAGYRIAVGNYRGDLGRSALIELADFVKISIESLPSLVVPGLVQSCRITGATLVGSHVRDAETLQRCLDLGFELFQGEYLAKPSVLKGRMLSPSQLICVRLLNDLADQDVPISRIEQLVGSDPGLTMRLLRSAHSAAGAGQEVESLRQALVLIGPRRLRSWVVLTLLEGSATQNVSDDLWSVLTRAHAVQRLAGKQLDLGFTVGLLAGVAELLGTDLGTVADASGVGHDTRAALVDGSGAVGNALRAVLAHEADDEAAVQATGLAPYDVSRVYLDALHESLQLVHEFLGR